LLLLFSVSINIISSYYIVYGNIKNKKAFAIAGVVINLSILLFFKYSPLFAKTFFKDSNSIGEFLYTLPLPIGISFFTFQGISLVIDVYNEKHIENKILVPKSFFIHSKQILFFKSFFPQLISGPIVKAHDFIPQISTKSINDIQWDSFFKNMVLGYFLKLVVADNLHNFTFWITYPYFLEQSTLTLVIMLFGFSCQIFADFAGYSLIAIGVAKLFGYNFQDNFNFPYLSTSFKKFWKRWHISLSSFIMEYLYIPLGGNRKGELRTFLNLMTVMVLGGLWHGASWSYAVWGFFHGTALAIERVITKQINIKPNLLINILKGFMVFGFITIAWLLFKLTEFKHVIEYFKCCSNNFNNPNKFDLIIYTVLYSIPVIIYHAFHLFKEKSIFTKFKMIESVSYGIMLFLIIVNSGSANNFIYFQF
jgi:alginate O-acetyltransferase complex protein AlgI